MKRFIILAVLALTACSKPQAEAPQPASVAAAEAPAPDSWSGKYEGDLMVNISGQPYTRKVWMIKAAADGCTGDIGVADNTAAVKDVGDDALDVLLPATADAAACVIHITRTGKILHLSESGGCTKYHGATCSFAGTATKVK